MYSSSYSRAKLGLESREKLHKPKGKSCGYYMKIFLFFSSLIQSLIIVSLVLFLIYGQPEKTAEEQRVKELELGFNVLSENNVRLRKEKGELGAKLAAHTAEKAALEKVMLKLKTDVNNTEDLRKKVMACERDRFMANSKLAQCPSRPAHPPTVMSNNELKVLQSHNNQQRELINLLQLNFTQMVQDLRQERDSVLKNRDVYLGEATMLRRESSMLREQLSTYTRKCKEDFASSLIGIQTVTKKFLEKINNVFPPHLTFHLTCRGQNEQLEKIKSSCTNLSTDIENKFQLYLDNVGNTVTTIQFQSSQLEVQNKYLNITLQQCEHKHSEAVAKATKDLDLQQKRYDNEVERLLIEQNRLREEKLQIGRELQKLTPPNSKAGSPNTGSPQTAPQQVRSYGGTPGSSKTLTVG
ncbi:plasmalemma vesicle associated protein b [Kryptolebias marmoratus]|uniref:Plasmalemma vesicle associated protein b n=1 Tax=Kryptolebias marmoratus TaxID=37003 RepID=A0A3Q2ZMX7_KRYMA|nr:plasmalemma vesicle associated protein b [Kryptolebias marmoratus]